MNPGDTQHHFQVQVPTTFKSSTTAMEQTLVRESDAGTPEQFPIKMFNVELLLSPNQGGTQGETPREKEQMEQMKKLQRRVKQSKRNLTKAMEGFINRVNSYKMNYPTDDKVEVISTKINDAHSVLKAQDTVYVRYIKLEDEVQKLQNSLITWSKVRMN